jgi:serine/threonine protein kinase
MFFKGRSIRERLKNPMDMFADPQRLEKMIVGIVIGMRYIHSIHIFQRDLNPDTILFDDEGRIQLFALGASKRGFASDSQQVGSPRYAAPDLYHDV